MKPIREKLEALRAEMAAHGVDAVIIPSADAHQSEYVADYWKAREYFSGFTGSMGTAVITASAAAVCTDGRYYIQAEREISPAGIELLKVTPGGFANDIRRAASWLAAALPGGGTVAVDPRAVSASSAALLGKLLSPARLCLDASGDLAGNAWTDRPALPTLPIFEHPVHYTGAARAEKLARLRADTASKGATHHLLSTLDDIAWLLNIRGGDVACTPVAYAYLLVAPNRATLFVEPGKASASLSSILAADGIDLKPYSEVAKAVAGLCASDVVLYDPEASNWWLVQNIAVGTARMEEANFVTKIKAIKNATEIAHLRACHIKDCAAMEKFLYWLTKEVPARAASGSHLTEYGADTALEGFRATGEAWMGPSFHTIAAYGSNAAMMHYSATEANASRIEPRGFLLVDSGGQYMDGTTDITRTAVLGPLTEEQRHDFTLVLQGHLALCEAKFVAGTTGTHLDILARQPLWKEGLDYKCGTGHAVGCLLGVHEAGPRFANQSLSAIKLEPGHVITNEPGIYKEGRHGVRLENTLLVTDAGSTPDGGNFLRFEMLSFCHIDREAIVVDMLSKQERRWVDEYHAKVYELLAPKLNPEEKAWLKGRTAPL